jgi:hypothetical protein
MAHLTVTIPDDVYAALEEACVETKRTFNEAITAAIYLYLSRHNSEPVAVYDARREQAAAEEAEAAEQDRLDYEAQCLADYEQDRIAAEAARLAACSDPPCRVDQADNMDLDICDKHAKVSK